MKIETDSLASGKGTGTGGAFKEPPLLAGMCKSYLGLALKSVSAGV
jgi:hypothetical protein